MSLITTIIEAEPCCQPQGTSKKTCYPPCEHNHDNLYYRKEEINSKLEAIELSEGSQTYFGDSIPDLLFGNIGDIYVDILTNQFYKKDNTGWVEEYSMPFGNYLPLAGGTMQGTINMNKNSILDANVVEISGNQTGAGIRVLGNTQFNAAKVDRQPVTGWVTRDDMPPGFAFVKAAGALRIIAWIQPNDGLAGSNDGINEFGHMFFGTGLANNQTSNESSVKFILNTADNNANPDVQVAEFRGSVLGRMNGTSDPDGYQSQFATQDYVDNILTTPSLQEVTSVGNTSSNSIEITGGSSIATLGSSRLSPRALQLRPNIANVYTMLQNASGLVGPANSTVLTNSTGTLNLQTRMIMTGRVSGGGNDMEKTGVVFDYGLAQDSPINLSNLSLVSGGDAVYDSNFVTKRQLDTVQSEIPTTYIESIVQGTNITIDATDPLNPIINATGGGSTGDLQTVTNTGAFTDRAIYLTDETNNPPLTVTGRPGIAVRGAWSSGPGGIYWDDGTGQQMDNIVGSKLRLSANSADLNVRNASTTISSISVSTGSTDMHYGNRSIILSSTAMTVSDTATNKGLIYGADYSANFTARSLVDKEYVDGAFVNTTTGQNNIVGIKAWSNSHQWAPPMGGDEGTGNFTQLDSSIAITTDAESISPKIVGKMGSNVAFTLRTDPTSSSDDETQMELNAGHLKVTGGDVIVNGMIESSLGYENLTNGGSIILRSPDGTRYTLTVSNAGALSITAAP